MEQYKIHAVYSYSAVIEAPTAEIAEKQFLENLNLYYESTEEFEITPVEFGDE
jgi:hypothetical protein